jgi:YbbR domain-containing protein
MTRFWPFRHFGLKLLSVGLAVLLWMIVAGEETVERGLRVPLELQQIPGGLELGGDVPTTVDVRVRGGSGVLSRVATGEVVAVLDLRSARSGRRLFPLTPEQVRVPFGVEVVQVMPSAVAIAFGDGIAAGAGRAGRGPGRPRPASWSARYASADPSTVEVVGPESAVKRASEAMTEPVSVAGAREDESAERVTVRRARSALRLRNPRPATVTVQIDPAPLERTLHSRPVHLRTLANNVVAEAAPPIVDVTIRGSREALTRVDADDVVAYVDLAGLGAGEYTLTPHVDVSQDAGVVRVEPSSVKVRITSAKR